MNTSDLSLEYDEISEEIQLKAQEELNETNEIKERCLEEIKQLLQEEKNLLANTSDNFLLRFLRARKFNTDNAFSLLKKYYLHRRHYKTLYTNYTPRDHIKVMKMNIMNFLPHRSPEGCAIWVSRSGLWKPEVADFETIVKFGLMCHEKALQNPLTQICGIISIVDLKKLSWSHLFHIPPSAINCFVSATQDCFPIRHKAIHIINNPSIFSFLFAVIKPLLNKKIKNKIFFHGDDLSSLHQCIPQNYLPKDFGGTKGNFENSKFYDLLLNSEEEFLSSSMYGYN